LATKNDEEAKNNEEEEQNKEEKQEGEEKEEMQEEKEDEGDINKEKEDEVEEALVGSPTILPHNAANKNFALLRSNSDNSI
jgi:nitrate reductase cytochrome c-type subunit